jgi:hypothetical protein
MAGFIDMAVTPNYGWPVPVATDYVKDGYSAIANLGDAIDATVFALPAGGLTLIKTQTIGTAVSTVTVTDAFSATYDNYKITISGGVASNGDMGAIRLGATTTGYYSQVIGGTWSASAYASGSTNDDRVYCFNHTPDGLNGDIEIRSPFLSKVTVISSAVPQTTSKGLFSIGLLNNTTSYTAFTLIPTGGGSNLTGGTIRVYGYQNS